MKNNSVRILAAAAALALFGCGGDNGTQPLAAVVVSLQPNTVSVSAGSTAQLIATGTRSGAVVTTETFTFVSDKPAVATVSSGGTVLGVSVGTAIITATGSSGTSATATVSVTPAPPATLEKQNGDAQAASSGTAVAIAPSVLVKDAAGKPVAGVAVTFAATVGGGQVTGATQTTSAAGVATVGSWTLGNTGLNVLTVSTVGLPSVNFIATGTTPKGTLALSTNAVSFSGTAGGANPTNQTVAVSASSGIVGALAVGAVTYGSGASGWLAATVSSIDAPALVILSPNITGLAAGTYTATVPVTGTNAVNSPQSIAVTLTISPNTTPVYSLVITQQPGNIANGALVAPQPTVEIRDASGAVVTAASDAITATLNGAGGVLSGTTTVSAGNGVAAFTNLRVTNNGRYSLTFSAPAIGTVTSNIFLVGNASPNTSGIVLNVGAAATATVAQGANIAIPLIADMSAAQGSMASITFNFTWDPTLFDLVSTANGTFGTSPAYFVNTQNSASGSVSVGIYDNNGLTTASGTPTIFTVTLKAKAASTGTTVSTAVTAAGDANGLALPAGAITVRPLTVTIP